MPVTRHFASSLIMIVACVSLSACGDEGKKAPADTGQTPTPPVATPPPATPPAGNNAPVITGSPATAVSADKPYGFRPSATDADGDQLQFSIANKPAWASFDTATGTLSGTPGASTVGVYSSIRISVSDGTATTSLPAFSVTVQAATLGSAALSWRAPSLNEDGTPVDDLSGYVVRYGTEPASLDAQVRIANPQVTSVVIEQLAAATWYFTVSAVAANGVESEPSVPVSKTIG